MADSETGSTPPPLSLNSHQTALCIVPPPNLCEAINRLRAQHDKSYEVWPPHFNLLYPFVPEDSLPRAAEFVRARLAELHVQSGAAAPSICLNEPGFFTHRHNSTVFVTTASDSEGTSWLQALRSALAESFRLWEDVFRPHLTIGQSQGLDAASREYLLGKVALLPRVEWPVRELLFLVRERMSETGGQSSIMRVWGSIDVAGSRVVQLPRSVLSARTLRMEEELSDEEEQAAEGAVRRGAQAGTTHRFDGSDSFWKPHEVTAQPSDADHCLPSEFSVSTYNVLVGCFYPPEFERFAILVRYILSESARADILVLQEVSDPFLSYLLQDREVRLQYPFTSHAPSSQADIGPLGSMRNIVVLSKRGFTWEQLSFQRRHKSAVIVKLNDVGIWKENTVFTLVIAAVHLTCGLSNSSVNAKKSQLQTVVSHLAKAYPKSPWLVAGDFNLTTSAFTIDECVRSKLISQSTVAALSSIESMLTDARLVDAWHLARVENVSVQSVQWAKDGSDDCYEGEEAATFDPLRNSLAAETVRSGISNRPQRYDKILVRDEGLFQASGYDLFGFPEKPESNEEASELVYGSDHWGVRASFRVRSKGPKEPDDTATAPVGIQAQKAPFSVASVPHLKTFLTSQGMFPTEEDSAKRKEALRLLKNLLERSLTSNASTSDSSRSKVSIVLAPVGSYALGVWNPGSDIDCLCIGNISSKTFFALAQQRLRRASAQGIHIVRRVAAATGKMLELDVRGVRAELHYCAATRVAEAFPATLACPPTDPAWDLSVQALGKLQPLRDLEYLQRTVADPAAFRLAHRLLRLWATRRGVYAARFGYLGGIHLTLLLARVGKLLLRTTGGGAAASAADLVATFFAHYARFDWANEMVYDPFFHAQKPRYHRTAREPMVVLSLNRPLINVARAASAPSLRTLVAEFQRADRLLDARAAPSWSELAGGEGGGAHATGDRTSPAEEFLAAYANFIKIDVQYWGPLAGKGAALLGWLESRCALLLVDLGRRLPNLHARIWPARFTLRELPVASRTTEETTKDLPRDYQGCYLIGLAKVDGDAAPASDPRAAQSALNTAMHAFAEQIRGDERHFDARTSWVDVQLVKKSQMKDLVPDSRSWAVTRFAEGDDDDSSDEEGKEDDDEEATLDAPDLAQGEAFDAGLPAAAAPTGASTAGLPSQPRAKLRPAADVLHRLRWDPALDAAAFTVGYEDRFVGVREMPLSAWKSDTTHDEFIPLHRVVWFQRRADGVKVWDRERRVDELFGSGVTVGETRQIG